MQKYVVIGTGGHANSILDLIRSTGGRVEYFFGIEDTVYQHKEIPVFELTKFKQFSSDYKYVFGIGDFTIRNRVFKEMRLDEQNLNFPPLIHPTAYVSNSASVGDGTVIFANSYIGPNSNIGKFCIVNTGAIIEHDCHLGDQNFLAPGTILAGNVTINNLCFIGMGSLISDGVSIGSESVIAANSFVNESISFGSFAAGTPAKIKSS